MDGVVGDCLSPQIVRRGTSDFTSVGEEEYTSFADVVVMNWQVLFECDIQHHEQEALQLLSISLVSPLFLLTLNTLLVATLVVILGQWWIVGVLFSPAMKMCLFVALDAGKVCAISRIRDSGYCQESKG
jgi:hypothetical protein